MGGWGGKKKTLIPRRKRENTDDSLMQNFARGVDWDLSLHDEKKGIKMDTKLGIKNERWQRTCRCGAGTYKRRGRPREVSDNRSSLWCQTRIYVRGAPRHTRGVEDLQEGIKVIPRKPKTKKGEEREGLYQVETNQSQGEERKSLTISSGLGENRRKMKIRVGKGERPRTERKKSVKGHSSPGKETLESNGEGGIERGKLKEETSGNGRGKVGGQRRSEGGGGTHAT